MLSVFLMTKNCFLAIGLILSFWSICQNSEMKGKTFLLCALLEKAVEARSKSKIIHFCFQSFLKPFAWLWCTRNNWRIFISTSSSNANHLFPFFYIYKNERGKLSVMNCGEWVCVRSAISMVSSEVGVTIASYTTIWETT